MKKPGFLFYGWMAALSAALALTVANLVLGELNQDEGWYLYAAQLVAEGALPYRDFAYTQTPLLPMAYAPATKIIAAWGVAGGRIITTCLGWLGAFLAVCLAARLFPERRRETALLAFALIAVNVYQSYFTTVVKTYSLTALCLTGGFLALSVALENRRRTLLWLAGALMALAAGTRSSAAVAPAATFGVLIWAAWRSGYGWAPATQFALGGIVAGTALFLPFLIMTPDNFWFNVVSYHALRDPGAPLQALVYKAGFISRMVQAYFPAFLLATLALIRLEHKQPGNSAPDTMHGYSGTGLTMRALWISIAGITLLHLSAPFPYDDYQVFAYPLFCAALAPVAIRRLTASPAAACRLALIGLLISGAAAASSPMNQDWFIQGRDRIWWRMKDTPQLLKLRAAGRLIADLSEPGDLLLTQDPYLAVESGRRMPHGLELGQFSYFPDFTDEQARRRNVLNRNLMLTLIETTPAPVAALSGYAFALESPAIAPVPEKDRTLFRKAILKHYRPLREIKNFGQASTTLEILTVKKDFKN